MDTVELYVITIYIAIITSSWMKNGMVMQSYESINNKNVCYEHHSRNFDESILRDITPIGLRIKKKPGINVISPDFMQQWNSALKNTERCLVELLRDETKKIVSSLDVEFETSLKEAYPRNLKAPREHIIKENVHLVESLQRRRNEKWRKLEGRVSANRAKRERNSDRFKSVNISDRQTRKRKMLIKKQSQECQFKQKRKWFPHKGMLF